MAAGARPRSGFLLERVALVALLPGSLWFPAGWLVGVVLVWTSRVWSTREKLLATLAPPFGLFPAIYILIGPGPDETCTGWSDAAGHSWERCTGGPTELEQALWIAAAVVLLIAPIVTNLYLGRRLRRPRAAGPAERGLSPA